MLNTTDAPQAVRDSPLEQASVNLDKATTVLLDVVKELQDRLKLLCGSAVPPEETAADTPTPLGSSDMYLSQVRRCDTIRSATRDLHSILQRLEL